MGQIKRLAVVLMVTTLISNCLCNNKVDPRSQKHYDGTEHNPEYDHEAVLGSKEANEEFGELEPEEAKKRLAVIIDKIDTDKNGAIDQNELTVWISNSFTSLNKAEVQKMIKSHDPNSDELVTWREYLHSVYGYEPEELEKFDAEESPHLVDVKEMADEDKLRFKTADQDNDGKLTEDEYSAFHHPHLFPYMADYELDKTIMTYDKNKDGHVDFKEFVADAGDNKEAHDIEKHTFETYDTNKDGILSRDELKAWVLPDAKDTVTSEVEHLFEETDVDKDNLLHSQEILNKYDVWVGSAATDYGNHLHRHDPGEL